MEAPAVVPARTTPEARSGYALLFAAILGVLLLLFMYSVAEILLLLFISALWGLYLAAITDFLQRYFRFPRQVGLLAALLLTTVLLVAVGWLMIPPVLNQTDALLNTLPALLSTWEADLRTVVARYPVFAGMLPPAEGGRAFDGVIAGIGAYVSGLFTYLYSAFYAVIHLFSVLVMGVYLALRPGVYRDGIIALVPYVHKDLVSDILSDLGDTLRAWIVGQLIAMVILGVLTWGGLHLLGVPYALAFGVFTGLVAIVPFFGTLVSTLLPAAFVLGAGGPWQAFLVLLLGVAVHLIEANFVAPLIMERQVHMPPVLSILSVLVMAELLGVVGLLVAVPTLATIMVIIRRIYIHRLLEGKGFRRTVRDAPAEIQLPPDAALVDPPVQPVSVPALLERSETP